MAQQLPAPKIRELLHSGKVIPFLGSGASLGDRDPVTRKWIHPDPLNLPNATELAEHLANLVSFPQEEDDQELTKVSKYYEIVMGRTRLDEELRGVFTSQAQYGAIHKYLAQNPKPLLVISTNYDDLMERALQDAGREFDLVVHLTPATVKRLTDNERADSPLYWYPHDGNPRPATDHDLARIDLGRTFVVYKMHGSIDAKDTKQESYVITEDDYVDFLTSMTSQSASAIPAFVGEQMAKCNLLFLGYSLRDWNLRVLLNQIDRISRRSITSWAIQFKPSPLEEEFWRTREVRTFDMKVDKFVEALKKV